MYPGFGYFRVKREIGFAVKTLVSSGPAQETQSYVPLVAPICKTVIMLVVKLIKHDGAMNVNYYHTLI